MPTETTSKHKVIKMIGTKNFVIELMESSTGTYHVVTETKRTKDFSIPVKDLATAMIVFNALYTAFNQDN